MRQFEKIQHYIIAYENALCSTVRFEDDLNTYTDIDQLEAILLELIPADYSYSSITEKIAEMIAYVNNVREQHSEIDINYIDELAGGIFYLSAIAGQSPYLPLAENSQASFKTLISFNGNYFYSYHEKSDLLHERVFLPLTMHIKACQVPDILEYLTGFRARVDASTPILYGKTAKNIFDWIIYKINKVKNVLGKKNNAQKYIGVHIATVETALDNFFAEDFEAIQILSKELIDVNSYSDYINNRFSSVIWDATNLLISGGLKEKACKYDCLSYPFYNEIEQAEIKRFYPPEMLTLPCLAFSPEECIEYAEKCEERNDLHGRIAWLLKAANNGDSYSQDLLGDAYAEGYGVTKNIGQAVEWYEKAAAQDNGYSLSTLANFYYNGIAPCKIDIQKAMDYWIRAVVALQREEDIDNLNDKFPGWETSGNPYLLFDQNDWSIKLRRMAKCGVPSAELWYGLNLLTGRNGCKNDCAAARRWLLHAEMHGYALHDKLCKWYDIDTEEVSEPYKMFHLAYRYSKLSGAQNEDLTFYWYYKAYHSGYEDAANNLGVCYDEGIGTEQSYKTANELYRIGITQNNSGSFYNYGVNLYYGAGVEKDIVKARKYLINSAKCGNEDAKTFLAEHEIIKTINYKDFAPAYLFNQEDFSLAFIKYEIVSCGIKMTFLIEGVKYQDCNFELEYCSIDGESQDMWLTHVEVENELYSIISVTFEGKYQAEQIWACFVAAQKNIEILSSYSELVIIINNYTEKVFPSLIETYDTNTESVDSNSCSVELPSIGDNAANFSSIFDELGETEDDEYDDSFY